MFFLRRRQKQQDDESYVLARMAEDYATGRWTLEQYEEMVWNRLNGRTPVDRNGWPLYYEDAMLNG